MCILNGLLIITCCIMTKVFPCEVLIQAVRKVGKSTAEPTIDGPERFCGDDGLRERALWVS